MAGQQQTDSIYRTILLPSDHSSSGAQGAIRLRHSFAKEGCEESQIVLAKNLLFASSNNREERDFNAQCAVYWLLQATRSGKEEAFELLENCAKFGLGINSSNCVEVKKCLGLSQNEKIARKIAYSIFRDIMADPEELIPSDLFGDKVDLIFQKVSEKEGLQPLIDETLCHTKVEETNLQNYKQISFSEVVNSVQSCLEGNPPLLSLKNAINYTECKWFSKKYFHILYDSLLLSVEKLVYNFSSMLIPFSVLTMIIFLKLIGSLVSFSPETDSLIHKYEASLVSSFVLICMVSSSCFVINIKFGGENLKRWLHLVKYFEPNISPADIERKHLANKNICPFIIFNLASFIYIAFIPESTNLISLSDIGTFYFMLMVFVDRTISHQRYFVNISLILNIVICFYKANILQGSFSNLMSYLNFSMDYELGKNLYVHISFISCIALPFVLPYLYLKMSLGKENKLWFLVLLPHLMSLTWLNLTCYLFQNVLVNLYFNVFSLLIILLLSNYTGFLFTLILFILKNIIRKEDYFRLEFLILFSILILIHYISSYVVKNFKISYASKLWSGIICLALIVLTFQSARPISSDTESASEVIPWEQYQKYCHHSAWYRSNGASVQISCLPLQGRDISFEGTVTSIDVIQVKNHVQYFLNFLPKPIKSWFVCAFGENYTSSNEELCKMYNALNIFDCHLHHWDVYKYQITVEISSRTSPDIYLIVDHSCSSFIKTLKEGDTLEAVGRLIANVGGPSPVLTLKKAKCVSCYINPECNIHYNLSKLPHFEFSIKNVVWYYLSPFIKYIN